MIKILLRYAYWLMRLMTDIKQEAIFLADEISLQSFSCEILHRFQLCKLDKYSQY